VLFLKTTMRVWWIIFWGGIIALSCTTTPSVDCGGYRWSLKTLTDKYSDSLLKLSPDTTSIDSLLAEKRIVPDFETNDSIRYEDEKHLVRVRAKLLKIKIGSDHDFHLVLKSASGKLMVSEIPDGNCSTYDNYPELRKRFNEERAAIIQTIGFTPKEELRNVNKCVIVEGIPFWDKVKQGHAPTYGSADKHEIHPVTKIIFE
jgi:hypothetical protein